MTRNPGSSAVKESDGQAGHLKAILAAGVLCGTLSCSAARHHVTNLHGIETCAPGAANALLSVEALQCWLTARHGLWRTLSHESHFDVLVVQVEAGDLRDAEEIAQRFVAEEHTAFSEILIYARTESHDAAVRIRRVRWTRERGTESIDFEAPNQEANP